MDRRLQRRAVQTEHRRVRDHLDLTVDQLGQSREQPLFDVDPRCCEDDPVHVAGDRVRRLRVERRAALVQRMEARLLLRERPVSPTDAIPGGRRVDLDVNGQRVLAKRAADRLGLDRATAERDHGRPLAGKRLERGLGLELAEVRLAAFAEDLRDRLPQRALELAVEVDEPPPQPLSNLRAERRLARAHETDEREVPV